MQLPFSIQYPPTRSDIEFLAQDCSERSDYYDVLSKVRCDDGDMQESIDALNEALMERMLATHYYRILAVYQ